MYHANLFKKIFPAILMYECCRPVGRRDLTLKFEESLDQRDSEIREEKALCQQQVALLVSH